MIADKVEVLGRDLGSVTVNSHAVPKKDAEASCAGRSPFTGIYLASVTIDRHAMDDE